MRTALSIALAVLVVLARGAAAEEPPADAAELLRQAKQAETGDRDVAKALELYRKVMARDEVSAVTLTATLRVTDILEEQGKTDEALELLQTQVTQRFGGVLEPSVKAAVRDRMLRLMKPGTTLTSPLGPITKPLQIATSGSPLDDKVRALVQRLDAVSDSAPTYQGLLYKVESDLRPVGSEALTALAKMIEDDSYERAKSAARLHARIGGSASVPVLERIAREGDPFARAAAIQGIHALPGTPEVAAALGPVLDRVLADPAMADAHAPLIAAATGAFRPEDLMERHRKGGPHAVAWLRAALGRGVRGAIARTLELSASGDPAAANLEAYAITRINVNPNNRLGDDYYELSELTLDELSTFVARLLPRLLAQRDYGGAANLLLGLMRHEDPRGPLTAWTRFIALPRPSRTELLGNASLLNQEGWRIPVEAFDDASTRAESVYAIANAKTWIPPASLSRPGLWHAVVEALRGSDANPERIVTMVGQALGAELPPKEFDGEWIDLLGRIRADRLGDGSSMRYIALAAARSGDPRFLPALRAASSRLAPTGSRSAPTDALVAAFTSYSGPGKREWLRDPVQSGVPHLHAYFLHSLDDEPANRALLVELAGRTTEPIGETAVGVLSERRATRELVALIQAEEAAEKPGSPAYREALVVAAGRHRLREAAPFLLREFRAGNANAQAVLNSIRAHYEQVASLEAWVKGGGSGKTDLPALLADPDPEIRRAAVLSLAALGDKETLPQLVRIAKEEKDPRVRQAALQAVERLAGSTAPAPAPAPAPPHPYTTPAMGN